MTTTTDATSPVLQMAESMLTQQFEAVNQAVRVTRRYGEDIVRYTAAEETWSWVSRPSVDPVDDLRNQIERLQQAVTWFKTACLVAGLSRDDADALVDRVKANAN